MIDRYRRSLRLARASFAILQSDRQLVLFPLVSFVALIAVLITFAIPIVLVGYSRGQASPAGYVLGFVFYVVAYTVSFYFNTALVGAALRRLDGQPATLRDGISIANGRLMSIIGYAVVAATVGIVLRYVAERTGFIGQIVTGIIGFAWSLATFLVVPVLAVENVGPLDAIKRSGELLRKTWGEQILGNVGIGLIFGLLILLTFIVAAMLAALAASISGWLAVAVVVAAILAVFALSLIASALTGIYTASLYRYATTGATDAFGPDAMQAAFRQKAGGVKGLFGGAK